jgi:hypothetical protein
MDGNFMMEAEPLMNCTFGCPGRVLTAPPLSWQDSGCWKVHVGYLWLCDIASLIVGPVLTRAVGAIMRYWPWRSYGSSVYFKDMELSHMLLLVRAS